MKRLVGCFLVGECLRANINVTNFSCLYLKWTLKLFCKHTLHTYVSLFSSSQSPVSTSFPLMHTKFFIFIHILKAYNNIRRATDMISHSSSERISNFNASRWWKISNVTSCFTAHIFEPYSKLTNSRFGWNFLLNLQWHVTHIHFLTLPSPCIPESCIKIKINLNFCFHTSL